MKPFFLLVIGSSFGALCMFGYLWSVHYNMKHPFRPHFKDLKDMELVFLFEERYSNFMHSVQNGENESSQWNDLRRMGEVLEELKHRKIGDMAKNDELYDAEQRKAKAWTAAQQGPGI